MRLQLGVLLAFIGLICIVFANADEQKSVEATCDEECICHPPPESNEAQYIVGYGSFIKQSSVRTTDPDAGEIIPVIVDRYQRAWNTQGINIGFSTTFLGIIQKDNSSFNGVVFPITPHEVNKTASEILKAYDLRERWYCRHKLPADKIKFLDGKNAREGEYWIYVNKPEFTMRANAKYPIVQSYVDVFIAGCLEVEKDFNLPGYTSVCIKSTEGWSKHWINDRIMPRRPWVHEPYASKIDKILSTEIPNAFKEIRLE